MARLLVVWIAAALTALPALGQSDAPAPAAATRERLVQAARDIMQTARYCALITLDETGRPHARTLDAFAPTDQMVVWLATNPKSRKVQHIRRDPRVTLYYFDPADPGYVTLSGRARLVDDPAEKRRWWKPEFEKFWPDRDASYLLIEVTPERLEVSSTKHGVANDPATWASQAVEFPAAASPR
jgi:general stress protein 26